MKPPGNEGCKCPTQRSPASKRHQAGEYPPATPRGKKSSPSGSTKASISPSISVSSKGRMASVLHRAWHIAGAHCWMNISLFLCLYLCFNVSLFLCTASLCFSLPHLTSSLSCLCLAPPLSSLPLSYVFASISPAILLLPPPHLTPHTHTCPKPLPHTSSLCLGPSPVAW